MNEEARALYEALKMLLEDLVADLAARDARRGLGAETIDLSHGVGELPPGSYDVDNFRGIDLAEEVPNADKLAWLFDLASGTYRLGPVSAAPAGGNYVNDVLEYEGETVEYSAEPVVYPVWTPFASSPDMEQQMADLRALIWFGA